MKLIVQHREAFLFSKQKLGQINIYYNTKGVIMGKRKTLSAKISKLIHQEANSTCPFCGERNVSSLEIHHIEEIYNGGTDEPDNLILVCANCHSAITIGDISKEEVIKKKKLLKLNALSKAVTPANVFSINDTINNGIIGQVVNIKTGRKSNPKMQPPQNSIAADLEKRNYIMHLIDRYKDYKKYDIRPGEEHKYAIIYRAIKSEFKCKWDMVPIQRFDKLVLFLQSRVDSTKLGRIRKARGQKNYSSFEEYLSKYQR